MNFKGEATVSGLDEEIFCALKKYTNYIGTTVFVSWVLIMAFYAGTGKFNKDSTDPPGTTRSGIALYTDNKTGCQYLGNKYGGMTPRLNKYDDHICESKN